MRINQKFIAKIMCQILLLSLLNLSFILLPNYASKASATQNYSSSFNIHFDSTKTDYNNPFSNAQKKYSTNPVQDLYLKVFMYQNIYKEGSCQSTSGISGIQSVSAYHTSWVSQKPYIFDQKFNVNYSNSKISFDINMQNINTDNITFKLPVVYDCSGNNYYSTLGILTGQGSHIDYKETSLSSILERYQSMDIQADDSLKVHFGLMLYDRTHNSPIQILTYYNDDSFYKYGMRFYGYQNSEEKTDSKLSDAYVDASRLCRTSFVCNSDPNEATTYAISKDMQMPSFNKTVNLAGFGDKIEDDWSYDRIANSMNTFNDIISLDLIEKTVNNTISANELTKWIGGEFTNDLTNIICSPSSTDDSFDLLNVGSQTIYPQWADQTISCTFRFSLKSYLYHNSNFQNTNYYWQKMYREGPDDSFLEFSQTVTKPIKKGVLEECPVEIIPFDESNNQIKEGKVTVSDSFKIVPTESDFWQKHNVDINRGKEFESHISVSGWLRDGQNILDQNGQNITSLKYQLTPQDAQTQISAKVLCQNFLGYNDKALAIESNYPIAPNKAIDYNLEAFNVTNPTTKTVSPGDEIGFKVSNIASGWTLKSVSFYISSATDAIKLISQNDNNPSVDYRIKLSNKDLLDQNNVLVNSVFVTTRYVKTGYEDSVVTSSKLRVRQALPLTDETLQTISYKFNENICSRNNPGACPNALVMLEGFTYENGNSSPSDAEFDWNYHCYAMPDVNIGVSDKNKKREFDCHNGFTLTDDDYGKTVSVYIEVSRIGYLSNSIILISKKTVGNNALNYDSKNFKLDQNPKVGKTVSVVGAPSGLNEWSANYNWYIVNCENSPKESCDDINQILSNNVQISNEHQPNLYIDPIYEGNSQKVFVSAKFTKLHYDDIVLYFMSPIIELGDADQYTLSFSSTMQNEKGNPEVGSIISVRGMPPQDSGWKEVSCSIQYTSEKTSFTYDSCDPIRIPDNAYQGYFYLSAQYSKPHYQNMDLQINNFGPVELGDLSAFYNFSLSASPFEEYTPKVCDNSSGCLYYGITTHLSGLPNNDSDNTSDGLNDNIKYQVQKEAIISDNKDLLQSLKSADDFDKAVNQYNAKIVDLSDNDYIPDFANKYLLFYASIERESYKKYEVFSQVYYVNEGKMSDFDPVLNGEMKVGKVISVSHIYSELSGYHNTLIWNRSGKSCSNIGQIKDYYDVAYQLTSADRGCVINVKVTVSKANMSDLTKSTNNATEVEAGDQMNAQPTIKYLVNNDQTGNKIPVGSVAYLSDYRSTWRVVKAIWFCIKVDQATQQLQKVKLKDGDDGYYQTELKDAGCYLQAFVTFGREGYQDTALVLNSVDEVVRISQQKQGRQIDGDAKVDGLLVVDPEIVDAQIIDYHYQWQKNGVNIHNANHQYLKVTADLLGSEVSVRVWGTNLNGDVELKDSDSVKIASGENINFPANVVKQGGIDKLHERYAVLGIPDQVDGWTISYSWFYGETYLGQTEDYCDIPIGDSSEAKGKLQVMVMLTKEGHNSEGILIKY